MPANLEIKVSYPNMKRIYPLLKALGASRAAILQQKDIYYFSPNGLLKLRKDSAKQEFIFYQRAEEKSKRWSEYYLLPMPDKKSAEFFSRALQIETIVEKKRVLFMFGNTRIHLDTVKNLGTFIELESVVVKGRAAAEKEFNHVKNALLLHAETEFRTSYRNLMLQNQKSEQ